MESSALEPPHPWLGFRPGVWSYDILLPPLQYDPGRTLTDAYVLSDRVVVERSASAAVIDPGAGDLIAEFPILTGERVDVSCVDGRGVSWVGLYRAATLSLRLLRVAAGGVVTEVALPAEVPWMHITCMRAGGVAGVLIDGSNFFWLEGSEWRRWSIAMPAGSTFSSVPQHTSTVLWLYDQRDLVIVPLDTLWSSRVRGIAGLPPPDLAAMPDLCSHE